MTAGFGERAIQEVTAFGDRELFSATLAPLVSPRTNRFSRSLRFERVSALGCGWEFSD